MNYSTFLPRFAVLLCLLFAIPGFVTSQNVEVCQKVAGAAGRDFLLSSGDWAGYSLEFTVGEAVIAPVGNSTDILTQGFHQPEICTIVSTRNITAAFDAGIVLFPNPADHTLHVSFSTPRGYAYRVQVVNAKGQIFGPERVVADDGIAGIDLGRLPSGTYWLRLYSPALPKPVMYPFVKK